MDVRQILNFMTVTFKKIKNSKEKYLVIITSTYLHNNILSLTSLNIHDVIRLFNFLESIKNTYKINKINFEYDDNELSLNNDLELYFDYCPF